MADRTRTYLPTDWTVWTYVPEPGSFVLDFSQLDGSDVLGSTGGSMAQADVLIGQISITEGSNVTDGLILAMQPSIMTATLIMKNFTADDSNSFYVGSAIETRLANENDSHAVQTTTMFTGYIDSFNVDVQPGADFATITISAISNGSKFLNTLVSITKNTTSTKDALITAASPVPVSLATSAYNYANTATESKTIGDWISDYALCDVYLPFDVVSRQPFATFDAGTGWFYDFRFFSLLYVTNSTAVGTASKTFDEGDISAVVFDWSGANAPTGVSLTKYSDSAVVYTKGVSTGESVGGSVYSATVDVKDTTQMTAIGADLLSMVKAFRPISVATKTATEYQSITFAEESVFYSETGTDVTLYSYPTNLAFLGQTVEITLGDQGFTNQKMIVTGRTIDITPDDWTTTYNLWKGFTN